MPNFSPPPTYIDDPSDPIWKKWFSELHQIVEATAEVDDGGDDGGDVPDGGDTGQVLTKSSDSDQDTGWLDIPRELPAGGTLGQALTKVSATDYNVGWTTITPTDPVDPVDTSDTFSAVTSASSAIDISDDTIDVWLVDLTENVTTVLLPTQTGTDALPIKVIITQDGVGNHLVHWPETIIWQGVGEPILDLVANRSTIVFLWVLGNGSVYGIGDVDGRVPGALEFDPTVIQGTEGGTLTDLGSGRYNVVNSGGWGTVGYSSDPCIPPNENIIITFTMHSASGTFALGIMDATVGIPAWPNNTNATWCYGIRSSGSRWARFNNASQAEPSMGAVSATSVITITITPGTNTISINNSDGSTITDTGFWNPAVTPRIVLGGLDGTHELSVEINYVDRGIVWQG